MRKVLQWVYTDRLLMDKDEDMAMDMLMAANRFQLPSLKDR